MERVIHLQGWNFDAKTLCNLSMVGRTCSQKRANCEECLRIFAEAQKLQGV